LFFSLKDKCFIEQAQKPLKKMLMGYDPFKISKHYCSRLSALSNKWITILKDEE